MNNRHHRCWRMANEARRLKRLALSLGQVVGPEEPSCALPRIGLDGFRLIFDAQYFHGSEFSCSKRERHEAAANQSTRSIATRRQERGAHGQWWRVALQQAGEGKRGELERPFCGRRMTPALEQRSIEHPNFALRPALSSAGQAPSAVVGRLAVWWVGIPRQGLRCIDATTVNAGARRFPHHVQRADGRGAAAGFRPPRCRHGDGKGAAAVVRACVRAFVCLWLAAVCKSRFGNAAP